MECSNQAFWDALFFLPFFFNRSGKDKDVTQLYIKWKHSDFTHTHTPEAGSAVEAKTGSQMSVYKQAEPQESRNVGAFPWKH